ncbi:hypothetical protein GYMLUDRAFT_140072, partial [Collybiopsis luxurians FD-317 M1]
GNYQKALELWEPILEDMKQMLGTEYLYTLICMQNLGTTYDKLGKYKQALEVLKTVVDIFRIMLEADHIDMLHFMESLALNTVIWANTQWKVSKLWELLVESSKRVLGLEHPVTVSHIEYLARTSGNVRKDNEALNLWESLVDISKSGLGTEHSDTLT